jgi:hypothetical protein
MEAMLLPLSLQQQEPTPERESDQSDDGCSLWLLT